MRQLLRDPSPTANADDDGRSTPVSGPIWRSLEQGTFWPTLAKWRTDNPSGVPDLSKAYLRNADLRGGDLSRTDLVDADLTGAVLAGTNLSEADLSDATLVDANLSGANLQSANFSESCSTALAWCRPILSERDSRGLISAERI